MRSPRPAPFLAHAPGLGPFRASPRRVGSRRALLLVIAVVAAAAALPACTLLRGLRPVPPAREGGVPAGFRLEVRSAGATNPHLDFAIVVSADGTVEYDVRHRGARPWERRGVTRLRPGGLAALHESVSAGHVFDLPRRIPPTPGGEELGEVTVIAADGRRAVMVVADRARHPAVEHLLRTLYYYVPTEVFRAP